MQIDRRAMLGRMLGAATVASLATGVPASFLRFLGCKGATDTGPRPPYDTHRTGKGRFLVLAMSRHGNPINANAPGAFDDPGIVHAPAPEAQAATFKLGDQIVRGAQAWSGLPQKILDRTCFFHGTTGTKAHNDLPKVAALMGASANNEMLPSFYSAALAHELETVLRTPVSLLGNAADDEYVDFEGRRLPNHRALELRDVLAAPDGQLGRLGRLRDRAMDALHARLRERGTAEEKAYVDSLAQSQTAARDLGEKLAAGLAQVGSDDPDGQIAVAAALIRMGVTPVVVLNIPFGGDNHKDPALKVESTELVTGVARIATLMAKLDELGVGDRTTFMTLNPFGRTLRELGDQGRNHLDHHVSVLIGKGIRPGVIGGVLAVPLAEYEVQSFDSRTGRAVAEQGDVAPADMLSSLAKTVGFHLGIPQPTLDRGISKGKIVPAALDA